MWLYHLIDLIASLVYHCLIDTSCCAVCLDAGSAEDERDKDVQEEDEKRSDDEGEEQRAEKRPHSDDDDDDRASKRSRSDVDDMENAENADIDDAEKANSRHSGSDSEIFGSDED